jgi:hypothetical protein
LFKFEWLWWALNEKFEEAGRKGAAGVLIVHNTAGASYPWHVIENGRYSSTSPDTI